MKKYKYDIQKYKKSYKKNKTEVFVEIAVCCIFGAAFAAIMLLWAMSDKHDKIDSVKTEQKQ